MNSLDAIAGTANRRGEQIVRVTRRLRPDRVPQVVEWLNQRLVRVEPIPLALEPSSSDYAIVQLFRWLQEVEPDVLERLGTLWSKLSADGFTALVGSQVVDQVEHLDHPNLGHFEGQRFGRFVATRHANASGRVKVAVRVSPHHSQAQAWLESQVVRLQRQIPPTFENLPGGPLEPDLPDWLVAAARRTPPRHFPAFIDARQIPELRLVARLRPLSIGAVSGLLKELEFRGRRAIEAAGSGSQFGPIPEDFLGFLSPSSGADVAAYLLEQWGRHGGYAAHRWCTYALLVWPSAENTRRLGRILDDFRSRLHSAGVRFGVRLLKALGDEAALALLARFVQHGSYAQSRDASAALAEAARTRGLDRADIEALAPLGMDDFGVSDQGIITIPFSSEVTAEIDVTDLAHLKPRWRRHDQVLRRAPRGVKAAHPEATKRLSGLLRRLHRDVRRETDQIEERLVELAGRPWSTWQVYFQHRLLRLYVQGLLWQIQRDGGWQIGVVRAPDLGMLCTLTGHRLPLRPTDAVRLLHPADLTESDIAVWRDRLIDLGLVQAFPQLDRRTFRGDHRRWLDFSGAWHDHLELGICGRVLRFHDGGGVSLKLPERFALHGRWRPSRARHWAVRALQDGGLAPTESGLAIVEPPPPDRMPDRFVDPFAVWVDRLHIVQDGKAVPGNRVPPRLFSEINLSIRHWTIDPGPVAHP
ncbi:MAG: DUF4132 domain-containing protein [Myxococcota bacterium]